jgi:succinate dehydrogenase/fumarate reductase flavoprotein subunit
LDAIVVGGGLAGLTASLTILDRGGRVALVEKEAFVGGNSQWASSGINGVDARAERNPDSVAAFREDCERSSLGGGDGAATGATLVSGGGGGADGSSPPPSPESVEHIPALAEGSVETLEWLRDRVGVDLSRVGRLGGHSHARTHRPSSGMAGSTLVLAVQKACDAYKASGNFTVMKKTKAEEILVDEKTGAVRGVRVSSAQTRNAQTLSARAVVLATGGFANDREGSTSLLRQYAPETVRFATTNTRGTTGDGHKMAFRLGAQGVDLANVQIHPTGFVDPGDPATTKTLAAEILRGAGALLLTRDGRRFADELGARDYLSGRMLAEARREAEAGGFEVGEGASLDFVLLMNAEAAKEADKHVPLYANKGLLREFDSVARVAAWMKKDLGGMKMADPNARKWRGRRTLEAALRDTLNAYDRAAAEAERAAKAAGGDGSAGGQAAFRDPLTNKTHFANAPFDADFGGPFYAGRVTPVVHYTMGGVRVDGRGRVVLNERRAAKTGEATIEGLYAAGEIVGGVHGKNRLGGNALTECAVFGRRVGNEVVIGEEAKKDEASATNAAAEDGDGEAEAVPEEKASDEAEAVPEEKASDEEKAASEEKASDEENAASEAAPPGTVSRAELAKHASAASCWVALYGEVYDFTDFLEDHPAGAEAIVKLGGTDGTAAFDAVHSPGMLEEFEALGSLWEG